MTVLCARAMADNVETKGLITPPPWRVSSQFLVAGSTLTFGYLGRFCLHDPGKYDENRLHSEHVLNIPL